MDREYIEYRDDIFELQFPQSAEELGGIAMLLPPPPPPSPLAKHGRIDLRTRSEEEEDNEENDAGIPTRAYGRRPYLVLIIMGFRITTITKRRYDRLAPLLRQLVSACMKAAKDD
jgi:hypothetical protein